MLPRQNSPPPLWPQPHTRPWVSTASPESYGIASSGSQAIRTPAGKRTRTGVRNEFRSWPSPSWPWVPRPQAYRWPLASSAYWVEFEEPTATTLPGRVSGTGDSRMARFPGAPPKNEPQCLTIGVRTVSSRSPAGGLTGGPSGRAGSAELVQPASTAAAAAATAASRGPWRAGQNEGCREARGGQHRRMIFGLFPGNTPRHERVTLCGSGSDPAAGHGRAAESGFLVPAARADGGRGPRGRAERMVAERVTPSLEVGERETLTAFLEFQRATLARKCDGLTDSQLRECVVPPSRLSLLGIVRHMAEVERNWFRPVLGGEPMSGIFSADLDWEAAFRAPPRPA